MQNKIKVLNKINELQKENIKNPSFILAIDKHCELITKEFYSKKLFYKFIFKNNRFLISTILVSHFYHNDESFLSDVKSECLKLGAASSNTITSLFAFMQINGSIRVVKSQTDKRKKRYYITEKGCEISCKLINTMVPSLKMLDDKLEVRNIDGYHDSSRFFNSYSDIYMSGVLLINLVEHSNIFIEKDSGHMIMVTLFKIGCDEAHFDEVTLLKYSKQCGISRTHFRSVLLESEKYGMIKVLEGTNHMVVTEKFKSMFLCYMSYYFAFVQYGFVK